MLRLDANRILASLMLSVLFLVWFFMPIMASASEINKNAIIILVNESRAKEGLNPVKESSILNAVAKDKVEDMIRNDYFAHNSPEGKDPWFWFEKNGYAYAQAGENLAINFQSVEAQHQQWMKSESHRKNILNPKFSEIGVAVAIGKIDGKETIITAQVFAAPAVGVVSQKFSNAEGKVLPAQKENISILAKIPEAKNSFDVPAFWLVLGLLFLVNISALIWVHIKREREELMLNFYLISQYLAKD